MQQEGADLPAESPQAAARRGQEQEAGARKVRKAIGQQLDYLCRNLGHIDRILNCLEVRSLNDVVAVRCYPSIKSSIYALKLWVRICEGIEVCELTHQSQQKGSKPRRHFVVNASNAGPRREGSCCSRIFPSIGTASTVTNLDLPVAQIWKLYTTAGPIAKTASRSSSRTSG